MTYRVHLENFEGPLDLLLYFIRRDKIDIYDIPIANITEEFMEMLEEIKKMNIPFYVTRTVPLTIHCTHFMAVKRIISL